MCKFWEGQSGLLEGKAGMLYAFSRMNSWQGLDSKICTIFQRNGSSYMKGQQVGIAQFFWGTTQETGSQNCAIPRGNFQLAVGVTSSHNYAIPKGNCQLAAGVTGS